MSAAHADERRALLAASDAINAELAQRREPRNERTAHAVLAATIAARRELARTAAPAPHAARPVPRWMQRVLGVLASADDPARIAPPTTGSREIPAWLLAVLLVLTALALTFAPGAQAAPIDCQGDVDYFARVTAETPAGLATWWTDCGYRYEWPGVAIDTALVPTPAIDVPAAPVPEPAGWMLFGAGGLALAARRLRAGGQGTSAPGRSAARSPAPAMRKTGSGGAAPRTAARHTGAADDAGFVVNGRPIAFPSRAHVEELCRTRANADNARWQQQVERRDFLISAATQDGYDRGERIGYQLGWHWGCICGIAAGGMAVGLLWIGWGPLQGWLVAWGLA